MNSGQSHLSSEITALHHRHPRIATATAQWETDIYHRRSADTHSHIHYSSAHSLIHTRGRLTFCPSNTAKPGNITGSGGQRSTGRKRVPFKGKTPQMKRRTSEARD